MTKKQIYKTLKLALIVTLILLVFEIIFSIDAVTYFFKGLITNSSGWVVYLMIFLIMYLQCTILNVPALVILVACQGMGLYLLSPIFLAVVIVAYMLGCMTAYWIGRKWGVKGTRWIAGSDEDFAKWSNFINTKGKWWYALTVLLPVFPDDILCLIAGSVKFNFKFFFFANLVGRSIGLVTMCITLILLGKIGGGFPFMIIVWVLAIFVEIIAIIVVKRGMK